MTRLLGLLCGVLNHLLFAVTVFFLYGFLAGWTSTPEPVSVAAVLVDVALCLQFAVSHSWLLHPRTRERIARVLAKPFYGTLFCTATCCSLLLTIFCWRPLDVTFLELTGWPRSVVQTAFILTWPTLLYSLSLTGLGHQTGFTSWWYWVRKQRAPFRSFEPRSLYHWFRHPIYLSFAGLLWFTPHVTLDRALLIGIWTIYIAIGSVLKDQRLVHYLGASYQRYMASVPGYPGVLAGPLGKVPLPVADVPEVVEQPMRRAA